MNAWPGPLLTPFLPFLLICVSLLGAADPKSGKIDLSGEGCYGQRIRSAQE